MAEKKHVFILSGQSNMSGRGGVHHRRWDGVVPPECIPKPSSILRFSAAGRWEPASDPLHADIDAAKTCGIGPGMSFANALLSHELAADRAVVVGLVPCAIGGTAIREWEKGTRLYQQMVRRARESVADEEGKIRAVLWYQGESDTDSRHDAEAYGANMERFVRDLRSDLGLPSLPLIQVAIISGSKHYLEKVREAQLGLRLPNVICVDAKGLTLNDDHLHLSTESQVLLGNMLAKAYTNNFLNRQLD